MSGKAENGSVYFARNEAGSFIKIGFTGGDVAKRIAVLRHDPHYPEPLVVVAVLRNAPRAMEQALHIEFSAERRIGTGAQELFRYAPRLHALVKRVLENPDEVHQELTARLATKTVDADLPGNAYGKGRRLLVQLSNEEAARFGEFKKSGGYASDSAAGAALIRIELAAWRLRCEARNGSSNSSRN